MTDRWIAPDRLFDGHSIQSGVAVRIKDGQIAEIGPVPENASKISGLLTPGYVDLQVNGGGGVFLNETPTRGGIAAIAEAHRRFGTVALLPTVITDNADVLENVANAAIAAQGLPGVVGLHIEGPHISKERRGTHEASFVRPFDDRTMAVVTHLRDINIPVMITLAPEVTSLKTISKLAGTGAVVSIGHTNATADQVNEAIEAGATCATHLFNAMSPMTSREPGAVGAVINSNVYSGIICDGHHVADSMVGLAVRARPQADRMILVSDSMSTVGGPDHFDLYGHRVVLKNGRLINKEGSLAGAHVTQAEGVQRLIHKVGLSEETALRMAISTPAACIGLPEVGQLANRRTDDVLLLGADHAVEATLTEALEAQKIENAAQ
ncbi:N-acetylglucosamine-6-phosphate deacetylase [Shimia sagamensis]|uniref:N-acetylglucosamine 6-phosphate deacetylase n=1 Tax=Shimia sagamensis TaxID=1566352 RepID=A0ABY1ND64_9RHOB|nr:N-acetylglucosamine-6-phosphate deacetylase [Shimia sagamensis]SMP06791.1 N-acetylglucosamine 6-phosphate deacetylase [Shimia sagamensis]